MSVLRQSPEHWAIIAIRKSDNKIYALDYSEAEAAKADAACREAIIEGFDLYLAINPLKAPLGRKASKDDVLEARWLYVDCDPPKSLTDAELNEWRIKKLEELRTGGKLEKSPTVIIDSGRGLWAFWQLRKAIPLDGARGENTQLVEAHGRALRDQFKGADSCQNVDRIARLPGYRNSRTGRIAKIVAWNATSVYRLDEFPVETRASSEGSTVLAFTEFVDDDEAHAAFEKYLAKQRPAIAGGGGRALTLKILNRAMDFGLRLETAARVMTDSEWNKTCDPKWGYVDDIYDSTTLEIAWEYRVLENSCRKPIGCSHPAIVREKRKKEARARAARFLEQTPASKRGAEDAKRGANDDAQDQEPGDAPEKEPGDAQNSAEGGAKEKATGGEAASGDKKMKRGTFDHCRLDSWLSDELPPRDYLMGEWLSTTSRITLIAETGVGKTLWALDLAAAIAAGVDFERWKGTGKPRRVMYIDGEMPEELMQERLALVHKVYGDGIRKNLVALNRDRLVRYNGDNADIPPLNTDDGMKWLAEVIKGVRPDLIVFDSMMALFSGSLKDDEQWEPVKTVLRSLSKLRIGQIWINHIGRDKSHAYGDTTREWEMDTIVTLTKAAPDDPQDGALEVDFEKKARMRTPKNFGQFAKFKTRRHDEKGWIVTDGGVSDFVKEALAIEKAEAVFLDILTQFAKQGRTVTATAGANYAPAQFDRHPRKPKNVSKAHLVAAMNRLLDAGRIKIIEFGPPSKRRNKLVTVEPEAPENAA